MPARGALTYAEIMAMVLTVVKVGEEFDVVDIRQLTDCEDDANAVNRAILQMAGYNDPVFAHVSRGRYRLLKYYTPTERCRYNVPIPGGSTTCPECHLALPASGECGYC